MTAFHLLPLLLRGSQPALRIYSVNKLPPAPRWDHTRDLALMERRCSAGRPMAFSATNSPALT